MLASLKPWSGIRKIGVLRANALGDFIFVLPALKAIRGTYPQAEIVYLGKAWHKDFALGHVTTIDRVITVPPCAGVGEAEDYPNDQDMLDQFFSRMRGEHFDIVFQMHGGGYHSNPFVNNLGAGRTIGSRTPDAEQLDISVPYVFYQNEILRYLEIASLAGAATEDIVPKIPITRKDIRAAQAFTGSGRYVVLHPGASDPRRRWPIEGFVEVARHFLRQNLKVYITGIDAEKAIVGAIVAGTYDRARSACDVLDLGGLAGLLAGAEVTISNDTGPLHLARAVNCPTVGLYWCGNYITAGPIRLAGNESLLSWRVNCPVCGASCTDTTPGNNMRGCNHDESFIQDIQAERVIMAAESVRRVRASPATLPGAVGSNSYY